MRSTPFMRAACVVMVVLLCIVAGSGCGAKKKKGGVTIAKRLEMARAEMTDEAKSRELTKVARLQLRSGDKSGAAKTLGEARQPTIPKAKPKPPKQEPASDEAAKSDEPPKTDDAPKTDEAPKPGDAPAADAALKTDEANKPDDAAKTEEAPKPEEPPAEEPAKPLNAVVWGPQLVEIAAVFAELGEKRTARDILGQALRMATEIEDPISRATLLAKAGGVYGVKQGGVGEAKLARNTLADAAEIAKTKVEERFRAGALAAVATGYVDAGLADAAKEILEMLEKSARDVENLRAKAEALAAAANVRAQGGETDAAKELLKEAAEAAKAIDGAENRTYALMAVAGANIAAGEKKAAVSLLVEAEKSAGKVGDPEAQKNAQEKVRALRAEADRKR